MSNKLRVSSVRKEYDTNFSAALYCNTHRCPNRRILACTRSPWCARILSGSPTPPSEHTATVRQAVDSVLTPLECGRASCELPQLAPPPCSWPRCSPRFQLHADLQWLPFRRWHESPPPNKREQKDDADAQLRPPPGAFGNSAPREQRNSDKNRAASKDTANQAVVNPVLAPGVIRNIDPDANQHVHTNQRNDDRT